MQRPVALAARVEMLLRARQSAHHVLRRARAEVRLEPQGGVVAGKSEQVLRLGERVRMLAARLMVSPQAPEDPEHLLRLRRLPVRGRRHELRRILELLAHHPHAGAALSRFAELAAQLERAHIGTLDLRLGVASGAHEHGAGDELQRQLRLVAFGPFLQVRDQLQAAPHVMRRLEEGTAVHGALRGLLPVADRREGVRRFGEVMRYEFGTRFCQPRKRFQNGGSGARVQSPADPLEHGRVGRLAEQGVLEAETAFDAVAGKQTGIAQARELGLQALGRQLGHGAERGDVEFATQDGGHLGDGASRAQPIEARGERVLQGAERAAR